MWTGYLWDNVTGSTCAAASDCIAEYPRLNCTGGLIDTCSVYFEGTTILSRDYINASVKWRTGLVYADFPGASPINRLATTTTVTVPTNAVYTGLPQGGSAVTTAGATTVNNLTVTYTGVSGTTYGPSTTAPTAAGTYSASASFAALPQAAPAQDHRSAATTAAAPMAAREPGQPARVGRHRAAADSWLRR